MGIKGLEDFVENNLQLLEEFELCNCNVLLDGNSIYHGMYTKHKLTSIFGGEYGEFYSYCRRLFELFQTCRIKAIVVFDGAQTDDRKWETTKKRAKEYVDVLKNISLGTNLCPLLLRQTFISVLDDMQIPYAQALGEADEECVSLANRLDCYLISKDSDYYCYTVDCGYIPFQYLILEPKINEKDFTKPDEDFTKPDEDFRKPDGDFTKPNEDVEMDVSHESTATRNVIIPRQYRSIGIDWYWVVFVLIGIGIGIGWYWYW
ncbi:unnamed protein product [Adineta steineri]|uniref:XPG N-terminal domain-containing protein n=1 Tax=Adineta steineri TaxID=433720 RepID=A0A818ZY35_9BILA|nr:unnamed protein product [Adineta steineri]CAF3769598.1 unnamed protein product [Adineta steineri]